MRTCWRTLQLAPCWEGPRQLRTVHQARKVQDSPSQPFLRSDTSSEAQRPAALLTRGTAAPQPSAIQPIPAEAPAAGLVCISPLLYFMWMFTVFMFYPVESFLPTRLGRESVVILVAWPIKNRRSHYFGTLKHEKKIRMVLSMNF